MNSRYIVIGMVILAGLISARAVWATPDQNPNRQTVPTRTPKVPIPISTREEHGEGTPTPVQPVVPVGTTPMPGMTVAPIRPLPTSTSMPVPGTGATALPTLAAGGAIITPTQTIASPSVSYSPMPATVPIAAATASATSISLGWLPWGIGVILVVGVAALVLARSKRLAG